jgi:hypothetical protein
MTDLVLDLGTQLGKSLVVAIGTEDGIVAEALCPTPLTGNLALDNALEQVLLLDASATTGTHIFL